MAAWTPEEDATIRAKARTHSATQIAALLPGRSRASVAGRAWRLGESLAKDETTRRALERPPRARRSPAPPRFVPEAADAWPQASPAARRVAHAVRPLRLGLEALGPSGCRWPYGEVEIRFCGHPAPGGGPYCTAHRGLAYAPDPGGYDVEALAQAIERREGGRRVHERKENKQ